MRGPALLDGQLDLLALPDELGEIDLGEPLIELEPEPGQGRLDFEIAKPPYRVLLMSEIAQTPANGYTLVSTFSGCGGSCLGFRMAGFRTLLASEFVPAAVETYLANHHDVPVCVSDVRELEPELILARLGLKRGELDVLEGSPPCASFSMAGKREAGWGEVKKYSDVEQRVDDLFFEFTRLVRGLHPRVVVAENVPGLLSGAAVEYFNRVEGEIREASYVVYARELNAAWYGVPQNRRRVIIIAVRRDLGVLPAYPDRLGYGYSIKDAIGVNAVSHIEGRTLDGEGQMDTVRATQGGSQEIVGIEHDSMGMEGKTQLDLDKPISTIRTPGGGANTRYRIETREAEEEASISRYAIGAEWEKLGPGESSDKYFNLVRPDGEKTLPTVTQTGGNIGAASVTHPTECRKFTIAELRRLCSFPDDFILTGSYGQQWERLGRAVPPLMMFAVARVVRDDILRAADGLPPGEGT